MAPDRRPGSPIVPAPQHNMAGSQAESPLGREKPGFRIFTEHFVAAEIHRHGGHTVTFSGNMHDIDLRASDARHDRGKNIQLIRARKLRARGQLDSYRLRASVRHGDGCLRTVSVVVLVVVFRLLPLGAVGHLHIRLAVPTLPGALDRHLGHLVLPSRWSTLVTTTLPPATDRTA